MPGRDRRQVVQAVGDRIEQHFDRPWLAGERRATRLVVIGRKGLDRAAIEAALANILNASARHRARDHRRRIGGGRSRPDPGRHRRAGQRRYRDRAAGGGPGAAARGGAAARRACASRRLCASATISRSICILRRWRGRGSSWPGCSAAAAIGRMASSAWPRPAAQRVPLALLPGDDKPDAGAGRLSTLPGEACRRLWRYLVEGGPGNADNLLRYAASLPSTSHRCAGPSRSRRGAGVEPAPLLRAGLYWPGSPSPASTRSPPVAADGGEVVPIVFYRALVQSGNTSPVDALVQALAARGLRPLPVFVHSLKETEAAALLADICAHPPAVILNATGFSVAAPAAAIRCGRIARYCRSCFPAATRHAGARARAASDRATWR